MSTGDSRSTSWHSHDSLSHCRKHILHDHLELVHINVGDIILSCARRGPSTVEHSCPGRNMLKTSPHTQGLGPQLDQCSVRWQHSCPCESRAMHANQNICLLCYHAELLAQSQSCEINQLSCRVRKTTQHCHDLVLVANQTRGGPLARAGGVGAAADEHDANGEWLGAFKATSKAPSKILEGAKVRTVRVVYILRVPIVNHIELRQEEFSEVLPQRNGMRAAVPFQHMHVHQTAVTWWHKHSVPEESGLGDVVQPAHERGPALVSRVDSCVQSSHSRSSHHSAPQAVQRTRRVVVQKHNLAAGGVLQPKHAQTQVRVENVGEGVKKVDVLPTLARHKQRRYLFYMHRRRTLVLEALENIAQVVLGEQPQVQHVVALGGGQRAAACEGSRGVGVEGWRVVAHVPRAVFGAFAVGGSGGVHANVGGVTQHVRARGFGEVGVRPRSALEGRGQVGAARHTARVERVALPKQRGAHLLLLVRPQVQVRRPQVALAVVRGVLGVTVHEVAGGHPVWHGSSRVARGYRQ
mmetsp:Transcript_10372/g.19676  ORF Transcript_10372/g.19676 Transcript_10372/m.19676 type:complete len:523 (-) Transcript_10372:281-1849(-)